MRFGLGVGGDLSSVESGARRAEELGFESVWVAETARSAFVQAAVAGRATSRVLIGTNIALAFPRSPALTAMEARDVAELSGGRFVLGLGAQVKGVMERRFGIPYEHPAPKLGEAVEAIRAVWGAFGGEPIDHRGRFYRITMAPFPGAGPPPRPDPRVPRRRQRAHGRDGRPGCRRGARAPHDQPRVRAGRPPSGGRAGEGGRLTGADST